CFQPAKAPIATKGRAANTPKPTYSDGSSAPAATTSAPAIAMLIHHGDLIRIANREFSGIFSFTDAPSSASCCEAGSIEGPWRISPPLLPAPGTRAAGD